MAAEATDLLARLLDVSGDAVVVAGADGRILRLNESARRLLGFKAGEGEGALHLSDIHRRPEDVRTQRESLGRRTADQTPYIDMREVVLRARNGDPVAVEARIAVVRNAEGRAVGTVHTYVDRREVLSLQRRLQELAAEVESWESRSTAQLSPGRTAHELSQPLTAALGHLDMLLIEGGLPDAAAERLERAAEQLERMRNLVHDLTRAASTARGRG